MIATVKSDLPASAEKVWLAVLRRDTFLYITRGMLGFRGADRWPETFREGMEIETRVLFFHVIPGWRHALRIVKVDEGALELASEERGGFIQQWDHVVNLERVDEQRCRYTDQIEIRAGMLTVAVWAYAHLFYRYRQRRWRQLARTL